MKKATWLETNWWPLGTESDLQPLLTKKTGTSALKPQETKFCHHLNEVGREP